MCGVVTRLNKLSRDIDNADGKAQKDSVKELKGSRIAAAPSATLIPPLRVRNDLLGRDTKHSSAEQVACRHLLSWVYRDGCLALSRQTTASRRARTH
jgi:hypothetical protein